MTLALCCKGSCGKKRFFQYVTTLTLETAVYEQDILAVAIATKLKVIEDLSGAYWTFPNNLLEI